jgi:hypothetical protein
VEEIVSKIRVNTAFDVLKPFAKTSNGCNLSFVNQLRQKFGLSYIDTADNYTKLDAILNTFDNKYPMVAHVNRLDVDTQMIADYINLIDKNS